MRERVLCYTCEIEFDSSNPEDRRGHAARHRRWVSATHALSYIPDRYAGREEMKTDGDCLLRSEGTLETRVRGAEIIVRARYDRSLEAAIEGGYWRKHPSLAAYTAMVNGFEFPDEIKAALKQKYGSRPGIIPPGKSYWYPDIPSSPYRTLGLL